MAVEADDRVPVTVVTGYLGAGKSTLLNHLLKARTGKRYAVIVNEFGDIGIDGALIDTGDEELIELSSGCICCVVRGDLIRTLRQLLKRGRDRADTLDGILIETTGVANPSPVIQTFTADRVLAALCRLDAVATVVDAVHIGARLADSPDAADQVALASVLVLNKVSDAPDADATERSLRALNPHAALHRTDRGRIAPEAILDTGSFSLARVADDLQPEPEHDQDQDQDRGHGHHHDHPHDHVAAGGISSLSFDLEGTLDGAAVEDWLERLLMLRGADILRLKGILSIAGEPRRVIVQSVHMMHEGDYGAPWGDAPRRSRLVIIGRNLDTPGTRAGIEAGLIACRAPENP